MHNHDSVVDRSLFSLSWPIFIDIFLHLATLLINTYMISQFSMSLVAATTVGNQVFDLFIPIFNFISIGCSVVIAQYLGAKNRDAARRAIHLSISFNFVLGLLCYLLIAVYGYQGLIHMNTPTEIQQLSYDYLHILGLCLIFEAVGIILASCLRVFGRSKAAMYVSLLMNVVTVIGDVLALYVFDLGLIGVAWSVVIGRVVGIILLFCLLGYGLRIKIEFKLFFKWNKDLLKKILKIGLPAAGENFSWSGQGLVMIAFIGLMGEKSLAAHAIYFQFTYFMMLFALAIGIGNEIIIGHLVGAKRFDDAYKRSLDSVKLGFVVTAVVVVVFFSLKALLVNSFTTDVDVVSILLPIFLVSLILEPGRTLNIVMVNALRATGDAKFPFYAAIVFMWGVAIPLGYLFGIKLEYGVIGIWMAFACDEWMRGLTNLWRWKTRRWESKRLDIESPTAP